ncbi:MAG TPA: alanine--glyoxylate aminotransferase family protein [candidate division Zixibacteria bacterium]|nr:alanine--glyoxylate aminotransferase family protein [candidate division Zixibacteria bacterium]MDD4918274.1 alanine--glyoxylate aminotransferase family protein [candidate division Zixibacteria bacterium]MDM7973173.1 alanine--glyoxylate aminotransferase family protein [candidate division Zixibacteria bacterium]HOD65853.1 alanine--glyoxylate aminotransferase family protein [candidate division Zixibacteria bacterium]HPM38391.1 alanine--glyoxylate aminotransferase family protein [candidate divis
MNPLPLEPPVRTLLGPGPSDPYPEVLAALARPTVGHLDPWFIDLMDRTRELLRYAFRTDNELTIALSGPGSAGMETCLANLIEPGDTAVVCVNGYFGSRMRDIVDRIGGRPVAVNDEWGRPVDPAKVEDALKKNPGAGILAFVHAETSTGAQSDAKTLAELARRHGYLALVDAVTSLAGTPLYVDDWQIDAVYSGSQKCLSCVPGLAPLSLSERALDRVRRRRTPVAGWFSDLTLLAQYWSGGAKRTYHHTAPVNSIYALYAALERLRSEGLENSWHRHRDNHRLLKTGLESLGLEFLVDESARLPQLNAVRVPTGVDEAAVRRRLLEEFNIEIGAGMGELAGKIWRIGLMGCSSDPLKIERLLAALRKILVA